MKKVLVVDNLKPFIDLSHRGARFLNLRLEHESAIEAFIRKKTA